MGQRNCSQWTGSSNLSHVVQVHLSFEMPSAQLQALPQCLEVCLCEFISPVQQRLSYDRAHRCIIPRPAQHASPIADMPTGLDLAWPRQERLPQVCNQEPLEAAGC